MGLDYSYTLIAPVFKANKLLQELAKSLRRVDRERLLAALPWTPEIDQRSQWKGSKKVRDRRGVQGLRADDHDSRQSYCLSYLFEPDPLVEAYVESNPSMMEREDGKVPIGCVWTRFDAGDRLVALRGDAATTAMSRLFLDSPNVRACWLDLARTIKAHGLFFDSEEENWHLVYPREREVRRPDDEDYSFHDDYHLHIDGYSRRALKLADIVVP